jgi:hypothetical protein
LSLRLANANLHRFLIRRVQIKIGRHSLGLHDGFQVSQGDGERERDCPMV